MDLNVENDYQLTNLGKINIILGKNGCGKSTLLKKTETYLRSKNDIYGIIKYITPERGGTLAYDPGVDNTMSINRDWIHKTRRVNRFENFRQQSVAQFRNLELMFYREMEKNESLRLDLKYNFESYFNKLNLLLDNIELRPDNSTFKIHIKNTDHEIKPDAISSGEAELISLGIECLVFEKECHLEKINILLLDEPDVHLHPDLQVRLSEFLRNLVKNKNVNIMLATHSTSFLGALGNYEDTHIEFMSSSQKNLNFKKITEAYRQIIPIFGAHPLSNIFNETPILLVEGEDDWRIWQQAVRSSNGKIKVYPCEVGTKDEMNNYENKVSQIINAIYDAPQAYSLRDRDDIKEEELSLEPIGNLKRFRLHCRTSENLLFTIEVLETIANKFNFNKDGKDVCPSITFDDVKSVLKDFIDEQEKLKNCHARYKEVETFFNEIDGDIKRLKTINVKSIRNMLVQFIEDALNNKKKMILERELNEDEIISLNTDWEIIVGQSIGKFARGVRNTEKTTDSLVEFLGEDVIRNIIFVDAME